MLLASKKYKLVYPKSYEDSDFEQFEFLFAWVGRRGELYQWLFENWDDSTATETTPINEADSTNVRSLINDELTTYTLTAENLTLNQWQVFQAAAVSKECFRVFKNGTIEKLAVVGTSYSRSQNVRFSFTITVQKQRNALAK